VCVAGWQGRHRVMASACRRHRSDVGSIMALPLPLCCDSRHARCLARLQHDAACALLWMGWAASHLTMAALPCPALPCPALPCPAGATSEVPGMCAFTNVLNAMFNCFRMTNICVAVTVYANGELAPGWRQSCACTPV